MKAYVRNQLITSAAIYLAFVCYLSFLWLIVSSLVVVDALQVPWTQIRRSGGAYIKASVLIIIGYVILLAVNPRYVSLLILPVIMLVFIGALFVIVSMKGSMELKCHQDTNISDEVNNASNVTPASEEDGNGGLVGDKDDGLFQIAVVPCWLLFCTGYFKSDNLVFSQFLLFLSSSLGELSLMMAKLPSQVAPAFEAVHRASLVAVLLTAHTMAAELLGDHAVLVCTPELVVALAWLAIHLAHGGATTIRAVEAALCKADTAVLGVVVPILTYLVPTRDESEGETNLLSSYMSASVACAISVILPSLCVFVLRQWRRQTTAAPSSEVEGSIRLLTFCRDIMLKAAAMFLVAKPLVDARLRLQMQGLATDIWSKFFQGRT